MTDFLPGKSCITKSTLLLVMSKGAKNDDMKLCSRNTQLVISKTPSHTQVLKNVIKKISLLDSTTC